MNSYALTLVLNTALEEKARQELLGAVTKKVAKITKEDIWGERELAYPINHQTKGFYVHYLFEAEPKIVPTLDKQLKLEEDIIRYLIIRA